MSSGRPRPSNKTDLNSNTNTSDSVNNHKIPTAANDPNKQSDDQQQQQQPIKRVDMNGIDLDVADCLDSFKNQGIDKFNLHHHRAYGIACSLYEINPITNTTVGDPIADVFAIMARRNSSILILADGVNWGPRSRLAARCAVRAAMNYINKHLFSGQYRNVNSKKTAVKSSETSRPLTTLDVFRVICSSFDAAQNFILRKKGTMTTLCCSVIVKLRDSFTTNVSSSSNKGLWVVCTLSIGDSTAYVFNRTKGVFELTYGARNLDNERDMRNVGGALGHVYGQKPDVSNLNYSLMYVQEGDIVFLVSDGVSDNLDPIVSQTAKKSDVRPKATNSTGKLNRSYSQSHKNLSNKSALFTKSSQPDEESPGRDTVNNATDDQNISVSSLPEMNPYERYICSLAHMNEILLRNPTLNETISAQETCAILIEHVMRLTAIKREILEEGLLQAHSLSNEDKALFNAKLRERVLKIKGKLDHASIVAYEVGNI